MAPPATLESGVSETPRACWVVTDGRAGIENQALGLAEAVARLTPLDITVKRIAVRAPWARLPRALWGDPFARLSPAGALLRPPYPALWIGCGRLSTPFTAAMRLRAPQTFTVQIQAPRMRTGAFDLVAPPLHDGLRGPNVFAILGAPTRVTRARLDADAAALAPALAGLPSPRIAVLLGGPNRAYRIGARRAAAIAAALSGLAADGAGLMVTASRRTPPALAEAAKRALEPYTHYFWDGAPVAGLDNPYFGLLGLANHILVTEDSVNMAAEAAMTGAPVHVLALDRPLFGSDDAKFRAFHAALEKRGAARRFDGALDAWTYEPLDETARIAAEVVRRLEQKAR